MASNNKQFPQKQLTLSAFFPAYNEEANIADTIHQADSVLKAITNDYEIIIVNDGSKDKTGEIAESAAKKNPHVRVIHHSPNQGYGAAVWSGFQAAKKEYVFFADSDLQFDLNDLKKLIKYIPEYKVVIGYRAKRRDPFFRLVNAKAWNILNRLLFGLKVKDIDCAFKLFERKLVVDLPIKSRGAMMSAELLIHLQRKGIVFKEIPVTHLPHRAGISTGAKPSVIFRAFRELFQTYRGELGSVTQRQLIKFAIVGIINTLIDFMAYILLTRLTPFFGDHLIIAKAVSFLVGSVMSFILNRRWTFRRTLPVTFGEIVRFYLTVGMALVINVISLFVFLRLFAFNDVLSVIAATITTFIWNFTAAKFWVFATREHRTLGGITIPKRDLTILFGLALITVTGMLAWLNATDHPPHWDMANHLRNSLAYTDILTDINESRSVKELLSGLFLFFVKKSVYYPPLAYWISVPFILGFGRTITAATMSNVVYVFILIFSLYGIGRNTWNRTTGLLAATIIGVYPFISSQFHEFQLDMPLTAMTALALFSLIKSQRWQNRTWSFLFGASVGLGMLTKWPVPGFLLAPVIYELIGALRSIRSAEEKKHPERYRNLIAGLAFSVLGLFITAGPWYLGHYSSLRADFTTNIDTGTREGDPSVWSNASLKYYFDVLMATQIRLPLLIPFIIGLVLLLKDREILKKNGLLITFVLGVYAVMTLYKNKDARFIEPILIGIAILSVYWISLLSGMRRRVAIGYILLVAMFQFITVNWGQVIFPTWPDEKYFTLPSPFGGPTRVTLYGLVGYTEGSPRREDWYQRSFITLIMKDSNENGKNTAGAGREIVMYYKDNPWFNRENFIYYTVQGKYPLRFLDNPPSSSNCATVDYIIATGNSSLYPHIETDFPYYEAYPPQSNSVRHVQPLCSLALLREETLPDQTKAFIWKVHR